MHSFIVVCPHRPLSTVEEEQAPFCHYPGFLTRVVDVLPSDDLVIIELTHIITHLTTFQRQAGTYGVDRDALVICSALNRGRR